MKIIQTYFIHSECGNNETKTGQRKLTTIRNVRRSFQSSHLTPKIMPRCGGICRCRNVAQTQFQDWRGMTSINNKWTCFSFGLSETKANFQSENRPSSYLPSDTKRSYIPCPSRHLVRRTLDSPGEKCNEEKKKNEFAGKHGKFVITFVFRANSRPAFVRT